MSEVRDWEREQVAQFRKDAESKYAEHCRKELSAPRAYALGAAEAQVIILCNLAESLMKRIEAMKERDND